MIGVLAAAVAVGWLGSASVWAVNSEKDIANGVTDLTIGTGATSDVTFTNVTYSPVTFTVGANLTLDSLNVLDTTQPLTITNNTANATLTLTSAAGGNVVAPVQTTPVGAAADLIYLANSGNLTIQNGTKTLGLALGSDGNFDVGSSASLTINSIVSGTFNLTKTGGGTLLLAGANTFGTSKTFTVSAGTVQLGAATLSLGVASNAVSVSNGAALDLNGKTFTTANAVAINGALNSTIGALTNSNATAGSFTGTIAMAADSSIGGGNGDMTLSGIVSGNFNLTKVGSDTLILSNTANTFGSASTTFTIGAGTVKLGAATTSLGVAANSASVTSGAVLDANGKAYTTTNTLTINGTGTGAGALTNSTGAASYAGAVALGSASTIGSTATAGTFTVGGTITGAYDLTLLPSGVGAITLTNCNNGGKIIDTGTGSGTVTVTTAGSNVTGVTEASSNSALTVTTLNMNAGGTTLASTGTSLLTITNSVVGSGNLTLTANSIGNITLTGGANNTGSITNNGSGTNSVTITGVIGTNVTSGVTQNAANSALLLNGANTFTTGLAIQSGTVKLGNTTGAGNGLVTLGVAGDATSGTLDLNGASRTIKSLATAGTAANQTITSTVAGGNLNYTGATTSTFGGVITGSTPSFTSVTLANTSAVLTLSGASTYAGGTTVTQGTLQIGASTSGSAGSITSGPLGTGALTLAGTLSSDGTTARTVKNAVNFSGFTVGNVTNNGPVTFAGQMNLTLSGNAIGAKSPVTIDGTATSSTLALSTFLLGLNNTNTSGAIINSQITGSGTQALNVTGGYWNLTNANNSFTGWIEVKTGTSQTAAVLAVPSDGALGLNSNALSTTAPLAAIDLNTATLQITANNFTTSKTISAASGIIDVQSTTGAVFSGNAGASSTSTRTLTLNADIGGSATYNGTIVPNFATSVFQVYKTGAGIWNFGGANTFSGGLSVNGGTLAITGSGTLGGTAPLNGTNNNGNVFVGAATLDLGGTTQSIWQLTVNNAGTVQNGTLNPGAQYLITSTTGTATISANLTGAFGVNKGASASTLVLSGHNTFAGQVLIQGGTLSVASFNSVNGGTPLLANSSLGAPTTAALGTLAMGSNAVDSSIIYTGSGETTDRVINLASKTGGVTIDQSGTGLLKFTSSFTTTGNGSKTLTLQGSNTGTGEIAGAIVDYTTAVASTSLVKAGANSWTLSGASTYTGSTTVNGGTLQATNNSALGFGGATTTVNGATVSGVSAASTLDLANGITVNKSIALNGSTNGASLINSITSTTSVLSGQVIAGMQINAAPTNLSAGTTVLIAGGGGTGATGTAQLGVTAQSFTISGGTQVYTVAPTVAIAGGTGATATAILTAGVVSGITITNPGTGFTAAPTITFSGGTVGTAGALPTGSGVDNNFQLVSLTETAAGSGFTSSPSITLSSGTSTGVAAILPTVTLTGNNNNMGGAGNLTINSVVGGDGFSKIGAGKLTLAAVNTYSGPTTVSTGTLTVSGTIDNTSAISAAASTTLNLNGGVHASNLIITNSGAMSIVGTGNSVGTIQSTTTLQSSYAGTTAVAASGNLTANIIRQDTLSIGLNGSVKLNESSVAGIGTLATGWPSGSDSAVNVVRALSFDPTAKLDVTNNDLIITGMSAATVESMVRNGYSNGAWDGSSASPVAGDSAFGKIVSTDAALRNIFTLLVMDSGNSVSSFDTVTGIPAHSVIVKFTHEADLNGDGVVTGTGANNDLSLFASYYAAYNVDNGTSTQRAVTHAQGDMDFDGQLTFNDSQLFMLYYNTGLDHLPEPTSLAFLALGAAGLLTRKRR